MSIIKTKIKTAKIQFQAPAELADRLAALEKLAAKQGEEICLDGELSKALSALIAKAEQVLSQPAEA